MKGVMSVILVLVFVQLAAALNINQIDLKVVNIDESIRKDAHIQQGQLSHIALYPGAKGLLIVKVQNQGEDVTNVRVAVDIGPFDGEDSSETASPNFDLDKDDEFRAEIEFNIPYLVQEGIYPVNIEVIGEDEDDIVLHSDFFIEIKKKMQDAVILVTDISQVTCFESVVAWQIINTGRQDLLPGEVQLQIAQNKVSLRTNQVTSGTSSSAAQKFSTRVPSSANQVLIAYSSDNVRRNVVIPLMHLPCLVDPKLQMQTLDPVIVVHRPVIPPPVQVVRVNSAFVDYLAIGLVEIIIIAVLLLLYLNSSLNSRKL